MFSSESRGKAIANLQEKILCPIPRKWYRDYAGVLLNQGDQSCKFMFVMHIMFLQDISVKCLSGYELVALTLCLDKGSK